MSLVLWTPTRASVVFPLPALRCVHHSSRCYVLSSTPLSHFDFRDTPRHGPTYCLTRCDAAAGNAFRLGRHRGRARLVGVVDAVLEAIVRSVIAAARHAGSAKRPPRAASMCRGAPRPPPCEASPCRSRVGQTRWSSLLHDHESRRVDYQRREGSRPLVVIGVCRARYCRPCDGYSPPKRPGQRAGYAGGRGRRRPPGPAAARLPGGNCSSLKGRGDLGCFTGASHHRPQVLWVIADPGRPTFRHPRSCAPAPSGVGANRSPRSAFPRTLRSLVPRDSAHFTFAAFCGLITACT